MATRENSDFLRFNAFAIKDLITRKLAQDSNYTDQIYAGSNIQILIDLFSYTFQTLLYSLNSAASESMFKDTAIYENINRLCSFLGYNPHGMNPAAAVFSIPMESLTDESTGVSRSIPRYSFIETDMVDSFGKKIYFSTVEDINVDSGTLNEKGSKEVVLYNGRWKLYSNVLVASGTDWETFTLNGLRSDTNTNEYVANNYIHVYVSEPIGNGEFSAPTRYIMTDGGLFKSRNEYFGGDDGTGDTSLNQPMPPQTYTSMDRVFNLRLDETKTYTITFGNNRQGRRLKKGSAIYVFYLDSNGPGINFGINQIRGELVSDYANFQTAATGGGNVYENVYKRLLGITDAGIAEQYYLKDIENVTNISQTISFSPEESVEDIRDFAPNWFRMGNRLVTQFDYEYYLNNSPYFRNYFTDVKCMNNWGYMSTFYKWLYEMGKKFEEKTGDYSQGGRRFLRQDNVLRTQRRYADPADSNNIYLWIVPNYERSGVDPNDTSTWIDGAAEDGWKQNMLQIKDLTHEPYFIPALLVRFAICACPDYNYIVDKYLNQGDNTASFFGRENYIEITIADEIVYANSSIQNQIQRIIYNFFKPDNFKIGQYVDFNLLQNQIFSINGVNKIRTVYTPIDEENMPLSTKPPTTVRNGLSFASWTNDDILKVRNKTEGLDLDVSAAGRSLEAFQFPALLNGTQTKDGIAGIKVKVIKRSAAALNTIAY